MDSCNLLSNCTIICFRRNTAGYRRRRVPISTLVSSILPPRGVIIDVKPNAMGLPDDAHFVCLFDFYVFPSSVEALVSYSGYL